MATARPTCMLQLGQPLAVTCQPAFLSSCPPTPAPRGRPTSHSVLVSMPSRSVPNRACEMKGAPIFAPASCPAASFPCLTRYHCLSGHQQGGAVDGVPPPSDGGGPSPQHLGAQGQDAVRPLQHLPLAAPRVAVPGQALHPGQGGVTHHAQRCFGESRMCGSGGHDRIQGFSFLYNRWWGGA